MDIVNPLFYNNPFLNIPTSASISSTQTIDFPLFPRHSPPLSPPPSLPPTHGFQALIPIPIPIPREVDKEEQDCYLLPTWGRTAGFMDLPPESRPIFAEGVTLVLSKWGALQMAVEKEWGGRDSRRKSEELARAVFSWFSQSKVSHLHIDELEHMLDENMVLSFNTEIADGSIEEVAEQLIIMHEDCLHGNYGENQSHCKVGFSV